MKLPLVSGSETIKLVLRAGSELDGQHGSHVVLWHADPQHRRLPVPKHRNSRKEPLRALIREVGMTVEEFAALL